MTYKEFMTSEFMIGLYWKYHMIYGHSISFIKSDGTSNEMEEFENRVIAKVDSERILDKLKNKNMARALCLIAQGYFYEDIAEELGLSKRTVEWYVDEMKRFLKKLPVLSVP